MISGSTLPKKKRPVLKLNTRAKRLTRVYLSDVKLNAIEKAIIKELGQEGLNKIKRPIIRDD